MDTYSVGALVWLGGMLLAVLPVLAGVVVGMVFVFRRLRKRMSAPKALGAAALLLLGAAALLGLTVFLNTRFMN